MPGWPFKKNSTRNFNPGNTATPPPAKRGFNAAKTNAEKDNAVKAAFEKYAGANLGDEKDAGEKEVIVDDKFIAFCRDIGIDPNGKMAFAWAWHWKCEYPGVITLAEFTKGMEQDNALTIKDLKPKVKDLEKRIQDRREFKRFGVFLFDMMRKQQETDKRTLRAFF
jgi:hypothetical protein